MALSHLGFTDKSRLHYESALELARELENVNEVPPTINLGLVLGNVLRVGEAFACQQRALTRARETGFRRGEAIAHVKHPHLTCR